MHLFGYPRPLVGTEYVHSLRETPSNGVLCTEFRVAPSIRLLNPSQNGSGWALAQRILRASLKAGRISEALGAVRCISGGKKTSAGGSTRGPRRGRSCTPLALACKAAGSSARLRAERVRVRDPDGFKVAVPLVPFLTPFFWHGECKKT